MPERTDKPSQSSPQVALEELWTTVDGLEMFARASSVAPAHAVPTIVLVHGLAVSGRYMIPLAKELMAKYRVYVPDLPGFGNSERPVKVPSIERLAELLALWMRAQGLAGSIMVANSMGCQVVVELARAFPELVAAEVMLGPTMDPSGGVLGQPIRLLRDQFAERPSLIALQAIDYLIFGPVRTFSMFGEALRHPMRERLRDVAVPVLVMRGTKDYIVSQEWADKVTARLPDARVETIEGAGHAINYNSAPVVASAVQRFIAELRTREKQEFGCTGPAQ